MKIENLKVKENISFDDKVMAIDYIVNRQFDPMHYTEFPATVQRYDKYEYIKMMEESSYVFASHC